MPERHIRVRGTQREDIDLDLVVQALLLIGEQRWRALHGEEQNDEDTACSGKRAAEDGPCA
ncbi:MAG: hypothetical protein WCC47_24900 [Pseudonocardiaceae bacterium]